MVVANESIAVLATAVSPIYGASMPLDLLARAAWLLAGGQSYGSVDDFIDILSGLAGLIFLAIILLVHEVGGSASVSVSTEVDGVWRGVFANCVMYAG
jgi:hypothetical protein